MMKTVLMSKMLMRFSLAGDLFFKWVAPDWIIGNIPTVNLKFFSDLKEVTEKVMRMHAKKWRDGIKTIKDWKRLHISIRACFSTFKATKPWVISNMLQIMDKNGLIGRMTKSFEHMLFVTGICSRCLYSSNFCQSVQFYPYDLSLLTMAIITTTKLISHHTGRHKGLFIKNL